MNDIEPIVKGKKIDTLNRGFACFRLLNYYRRDKAFKEMYG